MQFRSFALLAATTCAISAQAQEAPRFAVLNPAWLMENTAQGKRVFAEAQALNSRLTSELRAKIEELQGLEQQLRSSSLSDEGRARITRSYEDARTAFQRMQQDSQEQITRASQAAQQQFESEIFPIIDALAKEQKLQFILHREVALWADPSSDMVFTEEVGKRYDAAYPGNAAAAPRTTNTPNTGRTESGSRSATR